jgi:hypothetical protein
MLCVPCHEDVTKELLSEGGCLLKHTIESHLSLELYRDLHRAPKPMEVSWGYYDSTEKLKEMLHTRVDSEEKRLKLQKARLRYAAMWLKVRKAGKAKHLRDTLLKHPKPREVYIESVPQLQKKCATLKCLDAVGCRSNALLKCSRGLPVFSPIDSRKPFVRAAIESVDFVFVQVDAELHSGLFPYTGARWYAAEVVEYMLERGTIRDEDCRASLTATRHVEAKTLQEHLDKIKEVYDKVYFAPPVGNLLKKSRRSTSSGASCLPSACGTARVTSSTALHLASTKETQALDWCNVGK